MRKFKIKAFCKINLFLRVIKRLNNGYHDIRSLVTFCDLFDEISVKTLNGENTCSVHQILILMNNINQSLSLELIERFNILFGMESD